MLSIIEDFLPVAAVGAESAREKSLWRGHPSTLHLWWARRPLIACRAAVYAALVPADRWVSDVRLKEPPSDPAKAEASKNGKKRGLNRRATKDFIERLCKYPGDPRIIGEAERHLLEAHVERLNSELTEARSRGNAPDWAAQLQFGGDQVTFDDIAAGRAPRPVVLDLFAGGGAIPLEALRLGCDAVANDLNPVAHLIQMCALVFPQAFGRPNPELTGATGPADSSGKGTWGGLANEVRYWGDRVLKAVRRELELLHPLIPDPKAPRKKTTQRASLWNEGDESIVPDGHLLPVAYLWTRAVRCKNPSCGCTVPLAKQTWLSKKDGHYVALKPAPDANAKRVHFQVVEASTEKGLGFAPDGFSRAGNAACLVCGSVADIEYVKQQGWDGRIAHQLLAAVCTRPKQRGKVFVDAESIPTPTPAFDLIPNDVLEFARRTGISVPDEPIAGLPDTSRENSLGITVRPYGLRRFGDLYTPRQQLTLLMFTQAIHASIREMGDIYGGDNDRTRAVACYLAAALDRLAENLSSLCRWNPSAEKMQGTFGRQVITMVWDYCEVNPLGGAVGDWSSLIDLQINAIEGAQLVGTRPARLIRGSATGLPLPGGSVDAVITDPPYYDNVPYADISDFFYVWLKRSIGHLFPEHFASQSTPKKKEAIADSKRHGGSWDAASQAYEVMMAESFREACRVLKPGGCLVVVYAHKTTLGWSTLVDALRQAGFMVTEAWPLDTEMKTRLRGMESSALATSIFISARKRAEDAGTGAYESQVRPELETVVRRKVDILWDMEVLGADLVIAAVGAGLQAFTRFSRIEYANGELVPAEKFLAEVEGVVLDAMMAKLFGQTASSVSAIDPASRFYVLWRFVYKATEIEAGEAIVFTYAQHVELDGPLGLSTGKDALVEKKKANYRARDYTERGDNDKLGLPGDDGQPAPLIDVLHRVLWLMENSSRKLREFLNEASPDRERLRILAQALAGAALSGKSEEDAERLVGTTPAERAALGKLLANWRSVVDDAVVSESERSDRKHGQQRLDLK